MKPLIKILIISLYALFSSFLFAQQNDKGKWNFQIKAGGMLATHRFKDLLVNVQPIYDIHGNVLGFTASSMLNRHKYRTGFDLGFYTEYVPSQAKYLGFVGGISYRQRGFVASPPIFNQQSGLDMSQNNRLDYLNLDVGLKLKMTRIIYWTVGMRYDFLIYKHTNPAFSFYMDYFKGTEYSPFFIQGFNFNIFKKYTTALEFEVNPGVQKLNFNDGTFVHIPFTSKNYLTNFAMSLNLVVGIRK